MTQLSDTMKGFPAKDMDEFKVQTKEIGSDVGLALRLLSGFHPKSEPKPVIPSPKPEPEPKKEEEDKPKEDSDQDSTKEY